MLNRRQLILSELLLVSFMCHLLVFLFLFIFYNCFRFSTNVSVNRTGKYSAYFMCPSFSTKATTLRNSNRRSAGSKKSSISTSSSSKIEATTFVNRGSPKKVSKRKQLEQQHTKKTKKVNQTQKQKQKESPKITEAPKVEKKEVLKEVKKEEPKKIDPKPVEPKKEESPVHEKKEQLEDKPVQQPSIDQPAHPIPSDQQQLTESGQELVSDNKNFEDIGVCGEDFDTPRIQLHIQNEVSKKWTPPSGLPYDLVCQITIHVDNNGAIVDSLIDKSSGVLIFDVSARSAASSLSLPQWAWGREFTISFNQA